MGQLRPEAADELGLPAGLPVATGTGDVHSAAVGSGAVEDFAAHLYIGTSSWISCHVPFKKTDVLRNVASIPAALPGKYLVADEHETAGACLTFLVNNVLFGDDALGSAPPRATSTRCSTRWQPRWPRVPTALFSLHG
jgi:xylulokinase